MADNAFNVIFCHSNLYCGEQRCFEWIKYRNPYWISSTTWHAGVSSWIRVFIHNKLLFAFIWWWEFVFSVMFYSSGTCLFFHTKMIRAIWSESQNPRISSDFSANMINHFTADLLYIICPEFHELSIAHVFRAIGDLLKPVESIWRFFVHYARAEWESR